MKISWLAWLTRWPFAPGRRGRQWRRSRVRPDLQFRPYCEFLEDREVPRGGGGGRAGHAAAALHAATHHKTPGHAGRPSRLANPARGQALAAAPPAPTKIQPPRATGKAVFSNHAKPADQFLIGGPGRATFPGGRDHGRFHVHHHHYFRGWHFDHLRFRPPWWDFGHVAWGHWHIRHGHFGGEHHGWFGLRFHHFHHDLMLPHFRHLRLDGRYFRPPDRWMQGHGRDEGRHFPHGERGLWLIRHEHFGAGHHHPFPLWFAPGSHSGRIGEDQHDGSGHGRWEFWERHEEHRQIIVPLLHPILVVPPVFHLPLWHAPVDWHDGRDRPRGDGAERPEEHERRETRVAEPSLVTHFEPPWHILTTWEGLHGAWGFHSWGWRAPDPDAPFGGVTRWFGPPLIPVSYHFPGWARREEHHGWGEFHREGWREPDRERWYLGSEHWHRPPLALLPPIRLAPPVFPPIHLQPPVDVLPPIHPPALPLPTQEPAVNADTALAVAQDDGERSAGGMVESTSGAADISATDGPARSGGAASAADPETTVRDQFFADHAAGHVGHRVTAGVSDMGDLIGGLPGTSLAGDGLDSALLEWLRHKAGSNVG